VATIFLYVVVLEIVCIAVFGDSEKTVVELKAFFFYILFQWIASYNCFLISNFHDFFDIFSFSSLAFFL
jgi:hypothetical protein